MSLEVPHRNARQGAKAALGGIEPPEKLSWAARRGGYDAELLPSGSFERLVGDDGWLDSCEEVPACEGDGWQADEDEQQVGDGHLTDGGAERLAERSLQHAASFVRREADELEDEVDAVAELEGVEPGHRGLVLLGVSRTASWPEYGFEQAVEGQCDGYVDGLGEAVELGMLELGAEHREELRRGKVGSAVPALEVEATSKVPDPRSGECQPVVVVPERLDDRGAQHLFDCLVADADDGVGDEAIDGSDRVGQCLVDECLFGE